MVNSCETCNKQLKNKNGLLFTVELKGTVITRFCSYGCLEKFWYGKKQRNWD